MKMSDDRTNVYGAGAENVEPSVEQLQRIQLKLDRKATFAVLFVCVGVFVFYGVLGLVILSRPAVSGRGCLTICCQDPTGPWVSTGVSSP